jgi:hypothetical protein
VTTFAYLLAAFWISMLVFVLGMLAGVALSDRYERRHRHDSGWNIDADFARLDRNGRITR